MQWQKLLDDVEKRFVECHALRPHSSPGTPHSPARRDSSVQLDAPDTQGALRDVNQQISATETPYSSIDMAQVLLWCINYV